MSDAALTAASCEDGYWKMLDELVNHHRLVIDRPRGSAHPHFPDFIYPLDYGYLEGTTGGDGAGIDVWRGSLPDSTVTAVACCVDLLKGDAELKLLCGCGETDKTLVLKALNRSPSMRAVLVERRTDDKE